MDSDVDLTGRRVGRFEIRSLLGRGGMGSVYRAYDSSLDRHVAIKILPPHLVTDSDRVRRFVQEAKSASALNHPHVVSIYDIGQDDSIHYIAMELVEGATLRERLGGNPLEIKRAITIGEEVANAIGAAHEAGVVHRDLKPENIIVASSGYVKVLDFGLAKLRKEPSTDGATEVMGTEPGKVMGTVGYMSPEQAEGKPVDHRSDIFSLGCIVYEMVSGRAPFHGRTHVDTMHNIVHAEPAPLDAPAEMQRIVAKALAKAPEDRYQSAKDLAVDLKRLLRELDSGVTGSQPVTRIGGLRARRSTIVVAIAVVAAIIAAIVLWRRPEAVAPPKSPPSIQRITSTGLVIGAAISPDGKYLAYASSEQGQQGIWLRQLATKQDLVLVPPASVGVWGHGFSPDGTSIYYVIKSEKNPIGTLYVVSTLGGRSQKILDGIDSPVTFSPDGKRIAYARGSYPASDESVIMVANADGSGARILAKRKRPGLFVPIFYTGPSWSPDGKRIAASVASGPGSAKIIAIDANSGAEEVVSSGWITAQMVTWMPSGDSLVAVTSRDGSDEQVWLVPYPAGEPTRLTNDFYSYRMPTVTADGSKIVAVAQDMDAELWHVPLDGASEPRKIVDGKAVGTYGLSVAPDGSLAFVVLENGNYDVWIADANGGNQRQLTSSPGNDLNPVFLKDGRSLVYGAASSDRSTLKRIDLGDPPRETEIARIGFDTIALSPDGQTLVFRNPSGLVRAPVAGGTPSVIVDYNAMRSAVSPDGTRIACYCQQKPDLPLKVCILPITGGAPLQTLDVAGPHFASMMQWTADGKALLVTTMPRDRRNVWRVPLDGSAPTKVTNFSELTLFRFAQTPDGKALIASRGDLSRDAVMITGFR